MAHILLSCAQELQYSSRPHSLDQFIPNCSSNIQLHATVASINYFFHMYIVEKNAWPPRGLRFKLKFLSGYTVIYKYHFKNPWRWWTWSSSRTAINLNTIEKSGWDYRVITLWKSHLISFNIWEHCDLLCIYIYMYMIYVYLYLYLYLYVIVAMIWRFHYVPVVFVRIAS